MRRIRRWVAPLRLVPLILPVGLAMSACEEVTTPTVTPPDLPEVGLATTTTTTTTVVPPTSTVALAPRPTGATPTTGAELPANDAAQSGSPGGVQGPRTNDWDRFWTGDSGDGFGLGGFFAGFSSLLTALVAGVAYAAGSVALSLATLALLPGWSLASGASLRSSAFLGTLLGGFVGGAGILLAVLLVATSRFWLAKTAAGHRFRPPEAP